MKLKKSLIVGASIFVMVPVIFTGFANVNVLANESVQESVAVNQEKIDTEKLDSYVSFDQNSLNYKIDSTAKSELNEYEYNYLINQVEETNNVLSKVNLKSNESLSTDIDSVTITQFESTGNSQDSDVALRSRSKYREGITQVKVYWWGVRVWLSKTTISYIGGGIAIGGIWIPEPVVSKVVSSLGVVVSLVPGGIVFNTSPHIAYLAPGALGDNLYVWGASFQ